MLKNLLEHPLTRGLDIDAPETTLLRRRIIREKPFLKKIYSEWYEWIAGEMPDGAGAALEIGSGAGFLSEAIPDLVTSDLIRLQGMDLALDATALPLAPGTLRALIMVNVLHHVQRPRNLFHEAARCVRPGGAALFIEPWVTPWSSFVFGRLHHEPFDQEAASWDFPSGGPLSSANSAMPWIIFKRDSEIFSRDFPWWRVASVEQLMPLAYLLSGGISLRQLMPSFSYGACRAFERLLPSGMTAMFARIKLERTDIPYRD